MRYSSGNIFRNLNMEDSGTHGIFLAQNDPTQPSTCTFDNAFEFLTISNSTSAAFRLNDATCERNSLKHTKILWNPMDLNKNFNPDGGISVAPGGLVPSENITLERVSLKQAIDRAHLFHQKIRYGVFPRREVKALSPEDKIRYKEVLTYW